jgi:hypothetical protein
MKNVVGQLHSEVALKAPIIGISMGDVNDKQTWIIDFDPSATQQQRTNAQAVITGFDVNSVLDDQVINSTLFAENDAVSSTTSTTYQTKVNLLLPVLGSYKVNYSANIAATATRKDVDCKFDVAGVSSGEVTFESYTLGGIYNSFAGSKIVVITAPTTVSIMYRVNPANSATANIKNARIIANKI